MGLLLSACGHPQESGSRGSYVVLETTDQGVSTSHLEWGPSIPQPIPQQPLRAGVHGLSHTCMDVGGSPVAGGGRTLPPLPARPCRALNSRELGPLLLLAPNLNILSRRHKSFISQGVAGKS